MRLIVNHRDFPFARETRLARVVDVTVLVLLAALIVHAVRERHQTSSGAPAPADGGPVTRQVVLTIHPDGRWTLDGQLVPPADYEAELRRVFAGRPVKVLFVTAAGGRPYGDVRAAAERARAAGITMVGFLPAR